MKHDATAQCVRFPHLGSKPVSVEFDQAHSSSDGGALLLKAVDDELGLTAALADGLRDRRMPGKVRHSIHEFIRQRVFGIALGYPDGNDARGLADDPVHKLCLDRDPIEGLPLASQPTISRFENAACSADLYRMGEALLDCVIARHKRRRRGRRSRRITLDFDPTDDLTHGQQEFSFYRSHYHGYCYLPLIGTLRFDDESEQYLICALLRRGNASAAVGLVSVLRRVFEKLWHHFPGTRLRVRLDGGFGTPEVLDFLEANRAEYVVGYGTTAPLRKQAKKAVREAERAFRRSHTTVPVYGETMYQTVKTWDHERRVVFKAEVVSLPGRAPRTNLRFVVTNLRSSPEHVYRTYVQRGDQENRIKELKNDLAIDRTSCSRFRANQLRVLLTAAAYVLMQELRLRARHTEYAKAQVSTLRLHLLKLAAWVEVSVRRIVVHLPCVFPGQAAWSQLARSAGGLPG